MGCVIEEDIVIVGAGIAGLTTSLGLHRQGVRCLVLESSSTLRVAGFALTTWSNAWRALDAVGVGDILRQQHLQIHGHVTTSLITGQKTSEIAFTNANGEHNKDNELRCVKRQLMLEALAKELPSGTIRFSSKVVAIENSGFTKLVHLVDGTIIKTKVLVGCDGVNSMVAKWLGFKKVALSGRSGIRGFVNSSKNHGLEPKFMLFLGKGFRFGAIPCDDSSLFWFLVWTRTTQEKKLEDPVEVKQFVLEKLEKMPSDVGALIENTDLDNLLSSSYRYRPPWELIWGNISKGNVCVAGDAFHTMTPETGQGGCSALEDGIVLARCLGEAFNIIKKKDEEEKEQYKRIEASLKKYANERRWRSIFLIFTAYLVGILHSGDSKLASFLRDTYLAAFLARLHMKSANFDCGKLSSS